MSFLVLAVPLLAVASPTGPGAEVEPAGTIAAPAVPSGPVSPSAPASPSDTVSPAPLDPAAPAVVMPVLPGGGPVAGNDIVVAGRRPSPADPAEQLNAASFVAVQTVDNLVVGPVAHTYKAGVPEPLRDGVHNALNNLDEPIVFLNFLLQLKPGKAFETLGRFALNSTVGVAGLFDVARRKPFNLPRRSNGLADTLGYYGVGPGPYLFIPLIGSTTLRDLVARPFDLMILPNLAPRPFAIPAVSTGKSILSAVDERAQEDDRITRLHAARDPYAAQREEYLARRRAEIEVLKGTRKSIYDPPYYDFQALEPKAEIPVEAPAAAEPSGKPGQ